MRSPLEKGVPEGQGIDCLEEAEFCRAGNGEWEFIFKKTLTAT